MRRKQLGIHPARAFGGLAAAQGIEIERANILNAGHDPRLGIFQRVGVENAADARQIDEKIGFQRIDQQAREIVVVAEFEFVDGDGVVFVDHRDDAPREQFTERIADIEKTCAALEIVACEQHLRRKEAAPRKGVVVKVHKPPLPHGGGGLLPTEAHGLGRTGELAQGRAARAHRAGGHQHDTPSLPAEHGKLLHEVVEHVKVEVAPVAEDSRPHLDHHAAGVTQGGVPFFLPIHE